MTSTTSVVLVLLALIYRPLVMECLDPSFLRAQGGQGLWVHMVFLVLLVITLVAGFQVLGTLMVVGIMMLPATAARFWVRSASSQMGVAAVLGMLSSYVGLLVSYHYDLPASPAIIMAAGVACLFSILVGPYGGVLQAIRRHWARHRRLLSLME